MFVFTSLERMSCAHGSFFFGIEHAPGKSWVAPEIIRCGNMLLGGAHRKRSRNPGKKYCKSRNPGKINRKSRNPGIKYRKSRNCTQFFYNQLSQGGGDAFLKLWQVFRANTSSEFLFFHQYLLIYSTPTFRSISCQSIFAR